MTEHTNSKESLGSKPKVFAKGDGHNEVEHIYKCTHPNCSRTYTNKYSLWRHQVTHNPDRRFSCTICGKKFALAQYLKDHMNIHTGHKPYVCKFEGCSEAFSQAGKLSVHTKQHHGNQLFHVKKMKKRLVKE